MDEFQSILGACVNRKVRVHRHGPENCEGVVRACGSDYVVLESDEGELVIYPTETISALGMIIEDPKNDDDSSSGSSEAHPDLEGVASCSCLCDVLEANKMKIVKIGRKGPDCMRGLLLEVGEDYLTMVSDIKEIVHVPLMHVRALTVGNPRQKKSSSNSDKSKSSNSGWNGWF